LTFGHITKTHLTFGQITNSDKFVCNQGSIFRRIRRLRQPDPAGSAPDLKLPDRLRVAARRRHPGANQMLVENKKRKVKTLKKRRTHRRESIP